MVSLTSSKPTNSNRTNRIEGQLKKLTSHNLIRNVIFYDTETFQCIEENGIISFPFKLGFATYIQLNNSIEIEKREDKELLKETDFIDFIHSKLSKKNTLYIFAHNQQFDIRVLKLPFYFKDLGYKVELPIINMRTFIWKVNTPNGNMEFLDTANYAVSTVENLGYDMGYPKLSVDFNTVSNSKLMEYCARDVEILEKFILNLLTFIKQHELGSFKVTLASLSLSAYRTKFMDNPPHIHTNYQTIRLERNSYFGGRTEAWYIGYKTNERFYCVDVNSMYPSVMAYDNLPIRLFNHINEPQIEHLEMFMRNFYCIAKVKLETDENIYPLKDKGKLLFPIGEFITTLSDPEIRLAYQKGHIKRIYEIALYYRFPLFKDFVNYFYNLRLQYTEEGNTSWRFITKIFLNSLYGKFAQQQPIREFIGLDNENLFSILHGFDVENGKRYKETTWFGEIYKEYKEGETTFSFPALSSAITAYGRIMLWNYITIAGKENVFYMDTDSLIINQAGLDNLADYLNPTQLGKLKIENESSRLIIYGAKDYKIRGKRAQKGIKQSADKLSKDKWSQLQFQSFISWLNDMQYLEPSAKRITKRRLHIYTKGIKQDNGIVIPFSYQVMKGQNLRTEIV